MFRIAVLSILFVPAAALYSVHFIPGSGETSVLGKHGYFSVAPDASHVADIYARLAGSPPVLQEGAYFEDIHIAVLIICIVQTQLTCRCWIFRTLAMICPP